MANSVVKVTDSMLNDSLLLLVGEDGTVTPDQETVQTYLNSKNSATNIQIMHINKNDGKAIDVSLDKVTYIPDIDSENNFTQKKAFPLKVQSAEEMSRILLNFKLDHDYTPLTSPKRESPVEDDELVKTLSMLDGHDDKEYSYFAKTEVPKVSKEQENKNSEKQDNESKPKLKQKRSPKVKERDEDEMDFDLEEEEEEEEDNDSDFNLEDEGKLSTAFVRSARRRKSESKASKAKPIRKKSIEVKSEPPQTPPKEKVEVKEVKSEEKPAVVEKKEKKKEKKAPKPIPDDFALFSTPDVIRRVVKEPTTPVSESPVKPAKISQEGRSKSTSEHQHSPSKHQRLSVDSKISTKHQSPTMENKHKERRTSTSTSKPMIIETKTEETPSESIENSVIAPTISNENTSSNSLGEDLNSLIGDGTKLNDFEANLDQNNMNLDVAGLDLDQSLLDNINNDMISEDILYQVAQSLVSNTELQNAIEKGLTDGNLVIDPSMQVDQTPVSEAKEEGHQKGTQIVRPDGRIVVIPPIERPATRSRNRKKDGPFKTSHKPLDEEHVSGNELDSSGEEEESEDDPNKLWCICNQPHNNRFMICCDTCEEWYHGKCVNITKIMGQQMESEGKEWICLFCKDPSLRRPQAAARRIRKASRNSRASTDSRDSTQKSDKSEPSGGASVPCVVCQKPARKNSIFCSESCILAHAQGVEKVVVFERATGNMLSGSKAPSAANLEQWLKEHPGYDVIRAGGKVVTSKANMTQGKLKIIKNSDNEGVSLAVHKKGVSVGVLKHSPKHMPQKPGSGPNVFKIISKQVPTPELKAKLKQLPSPQQVKKEIPKPKIIQKSPKTPQAPPKPQPLKTPKARMQETQQTPSKQPDNIRETIQKTLFEQLMNRLKLVDDLKLAEEEVKNISLEIESQLFKCFGDTGQKYRNKYRSLIFNIKDNKNQTLWRRICEKSINPYKLVRLSHDDLASQELAMWREKEAKHQLDMIKKSELELLNCNRQYVLKTHKGEQVLEDGRPTDNIDTTEVITSLMDNSLLEEEKKNEKSKDKDKKSSKHSHRDKDRDRKSRDKEKDHRSKRSSSRDRSRKRSRSRDHSSRHSDKKRSRSRDRSRHRKSSHKSSRHKKDSISSTEKLDKRTQEILEQLVDNKTLPPLEDRLWKHVPQEDLIPATAESDSDHEPTSTVNIVTPPRNAEVEESNQNQPSNETRNESEKGEEKNEMPTSKPQSEIWRGTINMVDVAQISISAHEVSGDCVGLGSELPSNLDIVGRISPETVWDYIGKMKCSNSKIISLVRLNATNVEEKMPYLALYSYLSSRKRLGVVKSTNKAVKDFYILPLASHKPIPQALLPLNGPGFEEARPALLLGIIVRDKRKRSYMDLLPTPVTPVLKRPKIDIPVESPIPSTSLEAPVRSYTPPPIKDPRLQKLPLPEVPMEEDDGDEPYSPEDSDPDSPAPKLTYGGKMSIPGLDVDPSNPLELERQMEEINKKIEMQKSEIHSISKNIVSTATAEIGTSVLSNIALPSNLQQILDSIKTISAVPAEGQEETSEVVPDAGTQSDLTIPLMIPKTFTRREQKLDMPTDTIPLNLPSKPKIKPASVNSPLLDEKSSVLSSLSEEELIRKAAEMLGETEEPPPKKKVTVIPGLGSPSKDEELELPPIPGLEDEVIP